MSENGSASVEKDVAVDEVPAKKPRLDSEAGEFDKEIQKALEDIDLLQNDIDKLNEKASEEILKVEQKYNGLRGPLYTSRNERIKTIKGFWPATFKNHPNIQSIINPLEEPCIDFLSNFEVEEYEDIKSGYRIKFFFDENPYFTNTLLTKEFHNGSLGDPASQSTPIEWKEGCNLPEQIEQFLASHKKGSRQFITASRSFFKWFSDNEDPASDQIAEIFKEDIWSNPLQYFLVPDIEIENGGDDDDDVEEVDEEEPEEEDEDGDDEEVIVLDEEEEAEEEAADEEEAEEEGDVDAEA